MTNTNRAGLLFLASIAAISLSTEMSGTGQMVLGIGAICAFVLGVASAILAEFAD